LLTKAVDLADSVAILFGYNLAKQICSDGHTTVIY